MSNEELGKYSTFEYSRIVCNSCGETVDVLQPGQSFDGIKACECETVEDMELEDLTIQDLRDILNERDISFSTQAKAKSLIEKIREADKEDEETSNE